MAMKTFQECWTEYVGECKYSPYLDEVDTQFVEEVARRYAKEVQEAQIVNTMNYMIEPLEQDHVERVIE